MTARGRPASKLPASKRRAAPPKRPPVTGSVALVGAGPGDPGLITRRGAQCLEHADVVIIDRLVGPGVRALIPANTRIIEAGKQRGGGTPQAAISRLLIKEARAGRRVVRLKGGDPFVFGRGGEEAEALQAAAIPVTIVPGVSAAFAAPAAAGVPVTHRGDATSVTVLTASERGGPRTDWRAVEHADTVVVLMGIEQLEDITAALIVAGHASSTPAAVIADASLPSQRVVRGTLKTIAARTRNAKLVPPATLIVGAVAARGAGAATPAAVVLVTRPRHQAGDLADALRRHGLEPVVAPAISIEPRRNATVDRAFRDLAGGAYTWIVFTSANGVEVAFATLERLDLDARAFADTRIAAIGEGTAAALRGHGLRPDLRAHLQTSRGLAADFPPGNGFVLLPRAAQADPVLPVALERKGYEAVPLATYRIARVRAFVPEVVRALRVGEIAVIALASAETAAATAAILSRAKLDPSRFPVACIGKMCAQGARRAGFKVAAIADEPSIEGLADAALRAAAAKRRY